MKITNKHIQEIVNDYGITITRNYNFFNCSVLSVDGCFACGKIFKQKLGKCPTIREVERFLTKWFKDNGGF